MSLLAVMLIIISTFSHAGWNMMSKKANFSPAFFLTANSWGVLLFSPVLLVFSDQLASINSEMWIFFIFTGFFQAVYLFNLARAYKMGDMSLIYPIVRSLPIIMVPTILIFWGGERFSLFFLLGSFLVIAGLFMQWVKKIDKNFSAAKNYKFSWAYAILAALGTAGYSLIDGYAVKLLSNLESFTATSSPLVYLVFQGFFTSIWLLIFSSISITGRKEFIDAVKAEMKTSIFIGAGIYITYGLVLAAMIFAENVGYIVVFRQLSIPIGTIMGYFFLKEGLDFYKAIGTVILLCGLVLVAIS